MAKVSELIEQLADADLKQEKSAIITQLGELRDDEAIPILVSCLEQDDDIEIKGYAANALMNYSSNILTNSIIDLLKNESWVTRMKAVEILGELKVKRAIVPLSKIIRKDPETSVREWAAISLGKIGDKKAMNALIEAMKIDSSWEVRMEAAYALGEIRNRKAIKPLQEAFYSDMEYRVCWAVASTLAKIDKKNSKKILTVLNQELVEILKTEKEEKTLTAAARTLGEIGNEIAARTMLKTRNLSKEMVKLEIDIALGKIAKRYNYGTKEEMIQKIRL
ncbi:MAG: HEAT repeat domain-containing protein [Asgard group archaeon]|nr:HEAT repeat domain-containing protein [Asgard group archaeon]